MNYTPVAALAVFAVTLFLMIKRPRGLGLGTKMVDHVLEIAKEMGVETVYAIMLTDNYRALSLARKMGFKLEYLDDGTVKGILDLKEEILKIECPPPKATQEAPKTALQKEVLAKCEEMSPEESEATPA
jgi:GNAT superfamily N-acetyltransferase